MTRPIQTVTGRLSCAWPGGGNGPRPHNIPVPRTPEGDRIRAVLREVFQPPNQPFIGADFDYPEVEMRIVANKWSL